MKEVTEKGRTLPVDEAESLLPPLELHLSRVKAAKQFGMAPDMFDRFKHIGLVRPVVSAENVASFYS